MRFPYPATCAIHWRTLATHDGHAPPYAPNPSSNRLNVALGRIARVVLTVSGQ